MSAKSLFFRTTLFMQMNGRCFYCGIPLRIDETHETERDWLLVRKNNLLAADHVHPKIRGGKDGYANRICACYSCNIAKGALNLEEYRFTRALKARDFDFRFFGDMDFPRRDWLVVYSDDKARELFVHNYPGAATFYSRGAKTKNSWWARRK